MKHISQEKTIKPGSRLLEAIEYEKNEFEKYYRWLEKAMPDSFFEELDSNSVLLVTHSLMGFPLQDYFSTINVKNGAIAISLNTPDADLKILKNFANFGIKRYRAFVSQQPPPFPGPCAEIEVRLRIVVIAFTEAVQSQEIFWTSLSEKQKLFDLIIAHHPELTHKEFDSFFAKIDPRFLESLNKGQQELIFEVLMRARDSDHCQYEVKYNDNGQEGNTSTDEVSLQIVMAWRNCPKYNFLLRLARSVDNHHLVMQRFNAAYVDPYSKESILLMVLGLHGNHGEPAWEVANIPDLLRELVTLKYFPDFDLISKHLVSPGIISRLMGNLLRAMINCIHQILVNVDPHLYTTSHIEEDLCRHPELTGKICQAFGYRFDPYCYDEKKFTEIHQTIVEEIQQLDTGHEENDLRRKIVLKQALNFVLYTLKTNIYRYNYTALGFRLDPKYLEEVPFNLIEKYPLLPYGIFYFKGLDFFGYHVRFGDLARGGIRTVFPEELEHILSESNSVFNECYHLAYTQNKKNKDIPEAGAKGVIFIQSYEQLDTEASILQKELERAGIFSDEIREKVTSFRKEQKEECMRLAQRSYIEAMITLVNCDPDGTLKAKHVIDYWNRPEYLYLGPDENLHDSMIEWIANYSHKEGYKPDTSFITSKPLSGINHKEYGVTSLGVNVYMIEVLRYLGIDPDRDAFTLKFSGGPDGDVAGNQIRNLHRYFPKKAKILALTDISGTIFDPDGLQLSILVDLFLEGKPIRFYPPANLNDGGFLLDKQITQSPKALVKQTLCWKKNGREIEKEWLSGSEMNHLIRNNVHQTKTDIFIPAGGRPRTINEINWKDFLDSEGNPTSKAIIEGANLYLTQKARQLLEEKGVLIISDSSANKTGVICSSMEVLAGLTLGEEAFITHKEIIVEQIIDYMTKSAQQEANLLLRTHKETGIPITEISEKVSEKINHFTIQLLDHLDKHPLSLNYDDPLMACYINYCLPFLKENYLPQLISEIPEHHKKAIIARRIASQLVYQNGIEWSPTIVDILPSVWAISNKYSE